MRTPAVVFGIYLKIPTSPAGREWTLIMVRYIKFGAPNVSKHSKT